MEFRAGQRLRGLRELIGLTQQEFSDITGIDWIRLKNMEQLKARVAEDEFAWIALNLPPFLFWFACEGEISLNKLKICDSHMCKLALGRIESGLIPKGYFFEKKIK